jgi:DNA-directed RNA polymerase specialized sigma24 family protein
VPTDFLDPSHDQPEAIAIDWENDIVNRVASVEFMERLAGPPSSWPEVARMKYVECLTNAEIADRLKLTEGAVRARLSRFHHDLKKGPRKTGDS